MGAMLAADCLDGVRLRALDLVEPLSTQQATASLQLRVRGGWEAFTDPRLPLSPGHRAALVHYLNRAAS